MRTLDASERVRQVAQLERLMNEDAAVVPLMYSPYVVPHVAALKGPVAMQVPRSPNNSFLNLHLWEWRS